MRTRLAEAGVPGPAFAVLAAADPARRGPEVRRRPRLAGRGQGRPRRIRRQGRVAGRRPRRRRPTVAPAAAQRPAARRGAGADRRRARRAGRPPPRRRDGRVAAGRDDPGRRRLSRGARARPARPGESPTAAVAIARRVADVVGLVGVMAVELFWAGGRPARQRDRGPAAQLGPLDDRGVGHLPVREPPPGRARPAARVTGRPRPARRQRQRLRSRRRLRSGDPPRRRAWRSPGSMCTCMARKPVQDANWGT